MAGVLLASSRSATVVEDMPESSSAMGACAINAVVWYFCSASNVSAETDASAGSSTTYALAALFAETPVGSSPGDFDAPDPMTISVGALVSCEESDHFHLMQERFRL